MKDERLATLQQLLNAQQTAFNLSMVGRTVPVLLDRRGRRPGQLMGRSPWMQSVPVAASERLFGTVAEVEVTGVRANSLAGRIRTVDGMPSPGPDAPEPGAVEAPRRPESVEARA